MKHVTVLALSLGLFTHFNSNLFAQESGQVTHAPDGGFTMRIQSISIPTIPNAPFTATVRTEVVRRLEDGSTIIRKNHRLVARDSSGRVFEERRMLASDDDTHQSALTQIEFRNPVSQERYNCDPEGQTCHVSPYQPPPSALPKSVGGQNDQVTRVALGNSMVSGVETVGTRELTAIPASEAASNRPLTITKEFWYSAQLGINIVTKRFDPRSGTQTFIVNDLIVGEPNPSLLEVPAGATILRTTVQQPDQQ